MTLNTRNHNLNFIYQIRDHGEYAVYIDNKCIGVVKKSPGGWQTLDENNREASYRKGPREYAAEHLAMEAGLLDGNYNAI